MIIVLSPAKTLDFESVPSTEIHTIPDYLDDSCELVDRLKELEPFQLCNLMGISTKLGELNANRYQQWCLPFNLENAKQAVLAFKGDVYTGLQADHMSEDQLLFAQKHIRILSGLYGILRPLDLMQAYRLEMGSKFKNARGRNLYQFWGDRLTKGLNQELDDSNDPVLVNLASREYFKSIRLKEIRARVVTPAFKELKNGQYKIVSFYAKKARGLMAAYAVKNRITDVDDLKRFNLDGYRFNEALSEPDQWVFTREP